MNKDFYKYLCIFKGNNELEFNKILEKIISLIASNLRFDVKTNLEEFVIFVGDYSFLINVEKGDDVAIENKEMEKYFFKDWLGNAIELNNFENASFRLSICADDDFNMNYFNDSLYIVEIIQNTNCFVIIQNI